MVGAVQRQSDPEGVKSAPQIRQSDTQEGYQGYSELPKGDPRSGSKGDPGK